MEDSKQRQKNVRQFLKKKEECENVMKLKLKPTEMTGAQLKAVVTFKKRKGDRAIPAKKEHILERYLDTHERTDLSMEKWLSENGKKGLLDGELMDISTKDEVISMKDEVMEDESVKFGAI